MVTIIGLLFAISCTGQAGQNSPHERSPIDFLTGPKFHVELDQPATGAWVNIEFRPLLSQLAGQRRVAILLDRRIDPTVRTPIDIVSRSLKDGLREIAHKAAAEISVCENVVYIGPPSAVNRLRTLVELRSLDLQSKTNVIPERRRSELTRKQSVTWDDLETPGKILQKIASHWHVTIRNPELVSHDLWGGSDLPSVTAAEALSLVLIQFDLTFAWMEGGQGIELVPIPERVAVERRPRIKGRSTADTLKLITEQFPELDAHLDGAEFVVRGTLEEQEAVASLLNPSFPKKTAVQAPVPLRQQTFAEIKFVHVPVRNIMKHLEKERVAFVYDSAELTAAGIDLDREIDVTLAKASADELFKAVFSPLKLSFEIDNMTVKLTPKK